MALKQLSEKSGLDLRVGPVLANEVVILKCRDRPMKIVMDRLAYVLHGEWMKEGQRFTLTRGVVLRRRLEQEEIDRRAAWLSKLMERVAADATKNATAADREMTLKKAIESYRATVARMGQPGGPTGMSMDGPRLASPATWLLNDLLLKIGPRELAKIPLFEHVDYGTTPNPAQRAFPAGSESAISLFTETETAISSADESVKAEFGFLINDVISSANRPGDIGKVILTAYRLSKRLTFGLNVFDKRGARKVWAFSSTYHWGDPYRAPYPKVAPKEGTRITLSDLAQEFVSRYPPDDGRASIEDPKVKGNPSDGLAEFFLHPEAIDPLSLVPSEAAIGLADSKGLDLAACLPDTIFRVVDASRSGVEINLRQFELALGPLAEVESETKDGWLTLRASELLNSESFRAPRVPFGKLVRALDQDRKSTIRPWAKFIFEGGIGGYWSPVVHGYQTVLNKWKSPPLTDTSTRSSELLALLGSLDDAQWARLIRGETINVASASPSTATASERYAHVNWSEEEPNSPFTELERSPFERLQGAKPTMAVLWAESGNSIVVSAIHTGMNFTGPAYSATELANSFQLDERFKGMHLADVLKSSKYQLGEQKRRVVHFRLVPGLGSVDTLTETPTSIGATPVSFDDLPEAFRLEAEAAYQKRIKP